MTKPGSEERVSAQLRERLGVETYVPRIEVHVRKGRGLVAAVRPLFPNYIFARLSLPGEWRLISYTRGVTRVLGGWEDPKAVADEVIEAIREQERRPDRVIRYYHFQAEDRIHVRHGPLKDLYGIFERFVDDRGRVKVLLSLIGFQASAELDASALERA